MFRICHITGIISIMLLMGCGTTIPPSVKRTNNLELARIIMDDGTLSKLTSTQIASLQSGSNVISRVSPTGSNIIVVPLNVLNEREKLIYELCNTIDGVYYIELDKVSKRTESLEKDGKLFSTISLGIQLVGIAAGIAATALVVASPANAAWVAALTGVSSGAATYTLASSNEGFTRRDAISYQNNIKQKTQDSLKKVNCAELEVAKLSANEGQWEDKIKKMQDAINDLRIAAFTLQNISSYGTTTH